MPQPANPSPSMQKSGAVQVKKVQPPLQRPVAALQPPPIPVPPTFSEVQLKPRLEDSRIVVGFAPGGGFVPMRKTRAR